MLNASWWYINICCHILLKCAPMDERLGCGNGQKQEIVYSCL